MHARYYSPDLGRFLSVDPVGGKVGSSQSWNRYGYVLNNPLLLIDPTGREFALSDDDEERNRQLEFLKRVVGEAGKHLTATQKDGKWLLELTAISPHEFAQSGAAEHAMIYLMVASQTYHLEFGKVDRGGGAGFFPLSNTIRVDLDAWPRTLQPEFKTMTTVDWSHGVEVTAEEAFVHEMGHAISEIIPGVADRLSRISRPGGWFGPKMPSREGLSMALQNAYRAERGDGPRTFYAQLGDYIVPGRSARIFP